MITAKSGRLILECVACHKPVTGQRGWLHIDLAAVAKAERAVAEWHRQNPGPLIEGGAFLDYPDAAPWLVHHSACDPYGEDHDCYWFYAERCNTWPKLVSWTAHLMGKNWLEHTNWQDVLQDATAGVDA